MRRLRMAGRGSIFIVVLTSHEVEWGRAMQIVGRGVSPKEAEREMGSADPVRNESEGLIIARQSCNTTLRVLRIL
jgi:hypothetical protein